MQCAENIQNHELYLLFLAKSIASSNVNVPDIPMNEILGIKSTRLGSRYKSAPSVQDAKDSSLYWIGENGKEADNDEGTDFHATSNNYVSVTPLQIDLTRYSEVQPLSDWIDNINY